MSETKVLTVGDLDALLGLIAADGYRVVGPRFSDQAIVYDDVAGVTDMPAGWTDEQDGGHYRLSRRNDDALFGYAVGQQSWKKYLHRPQQTLWRSRQTEDGVTVTAYAPEPEALAMIGVRSCELHAIAIQDRVLADGPYADAHYAARRAKNFIVAVNCAVAGGTCFCTSMGTGPKATAGFDIALTELTGAGEHRFVARAATPAGEDLLGRAPARMACDADLAEAEAVVERTAHAMGRTMAADGVRELLRDNDEHPRWDDVAARCLSCGNCTMVCPTCFCTSTEDASDPSGTETEHSRRWDSCFTLDFSYIHGGSVRPSTRSRYRQWMTHKLSTWHDQFDTSGCVGCGRCITWCPVGIDITEEVRAIAGEGKEEPSHGRP